MKDLDIRLGDLFRIKKDFLLHNQVPDESGIENTLSVGLLTRIEIPHTEEHKECILKNSVWFQEGNLDDVVHSKIYKIMFPRIDQVFWFPEYKFFQMFEPLTPIKKKINKFS